MSTEVLSFEQVSYAYPDTAVPALREVSVSVDESEFVVVAGLSASGKSTFVRAASGLAPHALGGTFTGRVVVDGLDTHDHGPGELAAVVGTVLQDPETQVVMGSVRAELAFPLENRGEPAGAVARGVEEVALALGIAHLLDRSTAELSGGELQRVALGAALVGRPRLVLLDEPTSQLDPVAGDELIWLLRRLNEEWGTAVVLVEHRLERCLPAADRVLAFDRGALAFDGAPTAFLGWATAERPALATPAARLYALAGLEPAPTGVKQARAGLRARGLAPEPSDAPSAAAPAPRRGWRRRAPADAALHVDGVWHELQRGRAILAGIEMVVRPGERVALMGRNGAGKSTLLRHVKGLQEPTRGRIRTAGPVALLLQHPGDLLLADRVGDELPPEALAEAGLSELADRHPRDLSGGERQRLALAVAMAGDPPAVVCLDEPTRGMDRARKAALADQIRTLAAGGAAVVVATHDPEFAAAFADRVVLLADGRVLADGPPEEILAGGWYFATETARILRGAGGALTPEQGAALLLVPGREEVPA